MRVFTFDIASASRAQLDSQRLGKLAEPRVFIPISIELYAIFELTLRIVSANCNHINIRTPKESKLNSAYSAF